MRLLICGDRNWVDKDLIKATIAKEAPTVVIHGDCRGADKLAGQAAHELGIEVIAFPADWKKLGRAAGPLRNKQMLVQGRPDKVIAFHDDISQSKGTLNMLNQVANYSIPSVLITHS